VQVARKDRGQEVLEAELAYVGKDGMASAPSRQGAGMEAASTMPSIPLGSIKLTFIDLKC